MEHFVSSAFSLQTSRSFDAVRLIVSACIMTIADRVLRVKADDIPSEVSLNLAGCGSNGKPFAATLGHFAKQTCTIEVHYPELLAARASILHYFEMLYEGTWYAMVLMDEL